MIVEMSLLSNYALAEGEYDWSIYIQSITIMKYFYIITILGVHVMLAS